MNHSYPMLEVDLLLPWYVNIYQLIFMIIDYRFRFGKV